MGSKFSKSSESGLATDVGLGLDSASVEVTDMAEVERGLRVPSELLEGLRARLGVDAVSNMRRGAAGLERYGASTFAFTHCWLSR